MPLEPKSLKIIHLITELNTGGAEQMLYKVTTRMDRRRFRTIVVTMSEKGPIGRQIEAKGFPIVELGMRLGRPSVFGALKLYTLIRRERPSILQTWLYHADLLGIFVGKLAPVQRIVWGIRCSEMDLRNYRFLTNMTVKACARASKWPDAIIVNSEEGKRAHKGFGYRAERMVNIPNGFDTELFRPDPGAQARLLSELGLGREAIKIGLIARFDPMKDHANFLRAASLLNSKEDVHFVLAGRGVVPENRKLSEHLNSRLSGKVHFLGPRDDIARITPALDISTSSSSYGEGFSNTIGEAMACGIPCVVTDVGDSAAIVADTGFVVPPRDPAALAGAWSKLLEMGKEGRKRLGEQARARILENFSIEKVARQFEQFYEGIMQDPRNLSTTDTQRRARTKISLSQK
jgi:glycosyltransferase involved in cell wall biosynthesis